MPYPSLEFTVPRKCKVITPIGPVLVQTYLQVIYKEIIKGSVHNLNEDRLYVIPAHKRLLTFANNVSDTFIYLVIEHIVSILASIKDYIVEDPILDRYLFGKLDMFELLCH